METIRTPSALSAVSDQWRRSSFTTALVPTMGALHRGHANLVSAARSRADRTIVSIFVNPMQFNDRRDFESYPETLESDLALCRELGVDVVYLPDVDSMYPSGFSTRVNVSGLTDRWEGSDRPGHFDGVTTIVSKLFSASRADVALFGQKDFQQAAVIRRMAIDLDFPIEIVVCPTVRDHDGLALSSRNRRLDPDARLRALRIPAVIDRLRNWFAAGRVERTAMVLEAVSLLRAGDLVVHYVDIVDAGSLEPVDIVSAGDVLLLAASCDGVRLIDNHAFG